MKRIPELYGIWAPDPDHPDGGDWLRHCNDDLKPGDEYPCVAVFTDRESAESCGEDWSRLNSPQDAPLAFIVAPIVVGVEAPPARDWFADVCEFHRVCGSVANPTPTIPDDKTVVFRLALLKEEYRETVDAIEAENLPEIADGLADLAYVVIGTAVSYGIDLRWVWEAVHRANMLKLGGGRRVDGKHMKPPGWTPPDVAAVLADQPPIGEVDDTADRNERSE